MTFLKTGASSETVWKRRCKRSFLVGAFGSKPAKFKMCKLPQDPCSRISKQNSESKADKKLKGFQRIPTRPSMKKLSWDRPPWTNWELRIRPRLLSWSSNKRLNFSRSNSSMNRRKLRHKTSRGFAIMKCTTNLRGRNWSSADKVRSLKWSSKSSSRPKNRNLSKFNIRPSKWP